MRSEHFLHVGELLGGAKLNAIQECRSSCGQRISDQYKLRPADTAAVGLQYHALVRIQASEPKLGMTCFIVLAFL